MYAYTRVCIHRRWLFCHVVKPFAESNGVLGWGLCVCGRVSGWVWVWVWVGGRVGGCARALHPQTDRASERQEGGRDGVSEAGRCREGEREVGRESGWS